VYERALGLLLFLALVADLVGRSISLCGVNPTQILRRGALSPHSEPPVQPGGPVLVQGFCLFHQPILQEAELFIFALTPAHLP
jgi:hypothetical protein